MAKAIDTLSIRLEFKDAGTQQIVDKIKGSFKGLQQVISGNTQPAMRKLRTEINTFAATGNKSISTIEGQVTALRALRREADINSKEFKELTADIAKYERQLNKAQGRRGGGGARQATQVAGAVISGGIFGGPEGAIGGALGAFGGVQGAFAGAAIGAQVGNIRKSIGDAADYAAQIGKLKIALEGVVPNQDDFNSALETASRVTQELNVPQEQAVRGITRLSAAVKGAGGPVGDAETTFRNVTAAIKATGGSSEDVKGAITAMVQVFSKGKVSAEELSGQLGERLPGAVTLFAKANKMTLPELQKNLKAGTVGLNELMKFIEQLGVEFDGTAKTIASSNEEAGARLSVAFDEMRASVGDSLLETGANFQNAFAEFITDLTPKVVAGIELIKGSVSGFMKVFLPAAAGITTFILLVKGAAIIATLGGIATAIAALVLKIKILSAGLATVGLLLATNPLFLGIAAVSGIVAGIVAVTNAINGQAAATERLVKAGKSDTASADDKQIAISELTGQAAKQIRIIRENPAGRTGQGSAAQNRRRREAQAQLRTIERDIAIVTRVKKKPDKKDAFDYGDPSADPAGAKTGAGRTTTDRTQSRIDSANEIVRRLQDQLGIQKQQSDIGKLIAKQAKERSDLEARFVRLQKDGQLDVVTQAKLKAQDLLNRKQELALSERTKEIIEKATKPIEDITKSIQEKIRADKEYARLIAEGVNPELAKQLVEIEKQFELSKELLDIKIAELQASVDTADAEERTTETFEKRVKALEDLKAARDGLPEKKKKAEGAAREGTKEPTFAEQIAKDADDAEKALKRLVNPANQVKLAAGAIGDAFADSFMKVVTGKASAQEALSSFFQTVANHFLDMAKQIIAKQLVMITYQMILKALGAVSGGGGGFNSAAASPGGSAGVAGIGGGGMTNPFGNTSSFGAPFSLRANGGPVSGGQPYLVGERGPELFIPFQSGRVASNEDTAEMLSAPFQRNGGSNVSNSFQGGGSNVSNSFQGGGSNVSNSFQGGGSNVSNSFQQLQSVNLPFTRTSERITSERQERETAQAIANPSPIDVRFESQSINGVEYVTAEQHQQGMSQAAERGRALTLAALQNSVKSRRRVGL